jgi:hypothetical protein
MCGSVYRTGAPSDDSEACLDRDSLTVGSVVDRGKAGGDTKGGVVLLEERGSPALAGSVVRRAEGG